MILVVDDDKSILETMDLFLDIVEEPHKVAESSRQALNILRTEKIDTILADVVLMDGEAKEIVDECRKSYQNVKIVLMSAMCPVKLKKYAEKLKVDTYLSKPFALDDLQLAILGARRY